MKGGLLLIDQPPNCIPSLHISTALLMAYFSAGRTRAMAIAFSLATAVATIVTGEHYLVDLLLAIPFSAAVVLGVERRLSACVLPSVPLGSRGDPPQLMDKLNMLPGVLGMFSIVGAALWCMYEPRRGSVLWMSIAMLAFFVAFIPTMDLVDSLSPWKYDAVLELTWMPCSAFHHLLQLMHCPRGGC